MRPCPRRDLSRAAGRDPWRRRVFQLSVVEAAQHLRRRDGGERPAAALARAALAPLDVAGGAACGAGVDYVTVTNQLVTFNANDTTKPVKVTGVVKKVEWTNPHIWFYVDVKDESGKVTTWGFSGGPPGMLMRRGITREVLKPGDTVKVEGFRAKDGSNNASGGNVTFADGRKVFAGAAEDVVPQ